MNYNMNEIENALSKLLSMFRIVEHNISKGNDKNILRVQSKKAIVKPKYNISPKESRWERAIQSLPFP